MRRLPQKVDDGIVVLLFYASVGGVCVYGNDCMGE
jgi:hypothetical protein